MTRTQKKPHLNAPPVSAGLPAEIETPQPVEQPHQNSDRAAQAVVKRLSGDVSTNAFLEAWNDWSQHLARAPARFAPRLAPL